MSKLTKSRIYKCWLSMRHRCYKRWCHAYKNYGGRGIKVCKRWHTFANFSADMGPMPVGMCIDRIDNDGDYRPKNCRWITRAESNKNKRTVRRITFKGQTLTIQEWAARLPLSEEVIYSRLKAGWRIAKALTTPRLSPLEKGYMACAARWGYRGPRHA